MAHEFKLIPRPEYAGTDESAQDLLHLCLKKIQHYPDDYIGFDTETTGKKVAVKIGKKAPLDWMSDTVTFWSISFFDPWFGDYRRWCISAEYFRYFAPVLENPNAWLVIWNAKYDAHVSWNMGINIWSAKVIDGLALAGMHDENRMQRNLKDCAFDWCGLHMTKYKDLFPTHDLRGNKVKEYETDLRDLPLEKVIDYASYDSFAHIYVVLWLRDRLKATPISNKGYSLWDYYLSMERDVTEVLWRIERRGMLVDRDYLNSQIPIITAKIKEIEWEVNRIAGKAITINSAPQMAKLFFGKVTEGGLGLNPVKMTDGGAQPSVDKEVMDLLDQSGNELAQLVVQCRSLMKTKSTYIDALLELANYYQDHRIHPNFNQFGARTGRFSTDNPNSQNFPRPNNDDWGIRKAFIAPPGYELIVADYEQLEMRIMAHMSGDRAMIQAIQEGKDLHSFTVSRMVPGVTYEEVVAAKKEKDKSKLTKRQEWLLLLRQDMKAVGFGIIYGAGAQTIAQEIDIPDEDVVKRLAELQNREKFATAEDIKRGRTLSLRMEKAILRNPVLTLERAQLKVVRESIAQDKITAYFQTFPGVKQYMEDVPNDCRILKEQDFHGKPRYRPMDKAVPEDAKYDWDFGRWWGQPRELTRTGHAKPFGFVMTFLGRYRRLEDIDHKNYRFKSEANRQATNVTIQGSASDIIKGAMLRIERNRSLNMMSVEIVNQVHDELVCQCPKRYSEKAAPIIEECMIHPFGHGQEALCIPLPVDLKKVDRWSEAK